MFDTIAQSCEDATQQEMFARVPIKWQVMCSGRKRIDGEHDWYVPENETTASDTRCPYCVRYSISGFTTRNTTHYPYPERPLRSVNCDSAYNPSLFYVMQDGASFCVMDTTRDAPAYIYTDGTQSAGVRQFRVPPLMHYRLKIKCRPRNSLCTDFRVESLFIGNKEVTVVKGVYISVGLTVPLNGFTAGSTQSFKFVADTRKGRSERPALVDRTNVIRMKIQFYHRTEYRPEPTYRLATRGGGHAPTGASVSRSASACVGGRTMSGGQNVKALDTSQTQDTFSAVGEPIALTGQLVCFEPDPVIEAELEREQHLRDLDAEREATLRAHEAVVRAHEATLADIATRRDRVERGEPEYPLTLDDQEKELMDV